MSVKGRSGFSGSGGGPALAVRSPAPPRTGGRRIQDGPPVAAPPKTRRRSGVLAAGIGLVGLGSLAAVYLTQLADDTVPVLAVVRSVGAGEVLERQDLAIANVASDPALRPVPAGRLDSLLGQRTTVALTAGSLLTEAAVTAQLEPGTGRSLVGVALTVAQLPAEPLRAGDRVRIVDTPTSQADPPGTTPAAIVAEVVSAAGPDDTGLTVVNVTVRAAQAADLAARVATGRIALVLDSRER